MNVSMGLVSLDDLSFFSLSPLSQLSACLAEWERDEQDLQLVSYGNESSLAPDFACYLKWKAGQ